MDETLTIILKDTYSLSRLKTRLRILKAYLLRSFFGNSNEIIPAQDLNWLQSLPQGFYQNFTKDNVYQIFSALDEKTAKLPVLTMYLTFEPDEPTLNQIGSLARNAFNSPGFLLDIKLDPNLIAGAALSWKGRLRDYSLRAQIEARKEEISQGFKKFLR